MSDQNVWNFAISKRLTIVTKDADFLGLLLKNPDGPHVIHFRFGNMKIRTLYDFLENSWGQLCIFSREFQLAEVYRDHVDCYE